MHRYATYPAYKQSDIDRLDALPVNWNTAPLRRLLTEPVTNGLFKKREFWGSGVKIVNVFDAYVKGDVVDEPSLDRVNCDDSELKKYQGALKNQPQHLREGKVLGWKKQKSSTSN